MVNSNFLVVSQKKKKKNKNEQFLRIALIFADE